MRGDWKTLSLETYDPRLVSKTVVVRDLACKIPIEMAQSEKLAKAVFNTYTDKYGEFLNAFTSNLFGSAMRRFLDRQIAGYQ